MKKLFFFLPLLFPVLLSAQSDTLPDGSPTTIPFVAYWSVGDTFRYEVEKIDIRWQGEERIKADTSRYFASFIVLDSTETSYQVEWYLESYQAPPVNYQNFIENASGEATEMLSSLDFKKIIFTTTELGEFVEIVNLEDIQGLIKAFIDEMETSIREKYADLPEKLARADKAMAVTFAAIAQRQFIEYNMFVELIHLLHPLGSEFSTRDTLDYQNQYPNNFGGPSIPAEGQYYVDSLIIAEDYVHLKQYVELSEKGMREMLKDFMERIGLKGDQLAEMLDSSTYNIWEDNDYHYNYYWGIPEYVNCLRVVDVDIKDNKHKVVKQYILDRIE